MSWFDTIQMQNYIMPFNQYYNPVSTGFNIFQMQFPIFQYNSNTKFHYDPDASGYSLMGLSLSQSPIKTHKKKPILESISDFGKRMAAIAKKYLGYNEDDDSYKLFTHGREEAWCADFVSYIARQCGIKGFDYPGVAGILNWGNKNNKFHTKPKVGDVIIFRNWDKNNREYTCHTGIVTKIKNGRVYTIEGNVSDTVGKRDYALNDRKIKGYVRLG